MSRRTNESLLDHAGPDPDFRSEGGDWFTTRGCMAALLLAGAVVTTAGWGVWDHWKTPVEARR